MKTILTIIKKELSRFFKDRRFVFASIILPGLLIYVIYSLIGSFVVDAIEDQYDGSNMTVCVQNMPEDDYFFTTLNEVFEIKTIEGDPKENVKAGEVDGYIVFPEDLSASGMKSINMYYDSSNSMSLLAYQTFRSIVDVYISMQANVSFNSFASDIVYDLADGSSMAKQMLSSIAPMLLLMLMFSGCMPVTAEAIAGEKERGTIATLLVTPVKRSHIAIGKVLSLSVIGLLSGISSSLGLILSLPKLVGGEVDLDLSIYGASQYLQIVAVILSTVLLFVALISVISTNAKSIKEASSMQLPIMIVIIVCGFSTMLLQGAPSTGLFFIPIFNSALAIFGIFSESVGAVAILITILTNLVVTGLVVFLLTKMFNNEKIMFNK